MLELALRNRMHSTLSSLKLKCPKGCLSCSQKKSQRGKRKRLERGNNQKHPMAAEDSLQEMVVEFEDQSRSDVVVRLISEDPKEEPLDMHLHQSFLVEHSAFFAAQLSEVWAAACTDRDARGRPIFGVRGCSDPNAFYDALEKLYEQGRRARANLPFRTALFTSFEDAARCLLPADRLGLESVSRAAAEYLENVAWITPAQREAIIALTGCQSDNPIVGGLLDRLAPPTEDQRPEILNELLKKACPVWPPEMLLHELSSRDNARAFIAATLRDPLTSTDGKQSLLAAISRRLTKLQNMLSPLLSYENYSQNNVCNKINGVMSSLEWVLHLSAGDLDFRADVADLLTSLKVRAYADPNVTQSTGIDDCVYLLEEVSDGNLTLDSDVRVKLLKFVIDWAFREGSDAPPLGAKEHEILEVPFCAALATVDWAAQKEILAPWLPHLMQTWHSWFDEWMTNSLTSEKQVLKSSSAPASDTRAEKRLKTSSDDSGSKDTSTS